MKQKINPAYQIIIESLKKYSFKNRIPIERARYIISFVHRFSRPANTKIIHDLCKLGIVKTQLGSGELEIVC